MDTSTNLNLPYIAAAQAQKHVTHNEAIRSLDAVVQLSVADRDLTAPPASPADGVRYLIASPATGAWINQDGNIAARQDGAWMFYQPRVGWLIWVEDEAAIIVRSETSWIELTAFASGMVNQLGIHASADATNRLAVKSDAVLFSHDDSTPGTGSIYHKINKSSASHTASVLFQTGYSGRAEFGLTGNDNFHVKVSADGSTWKNALIVDATSGTINMPFTPRRDVLTANRTYYVRSDGSDSNNGLSNASAGAFLTLQKALDTAAALDISVHTVTVKVGPGTFVGAQVKRPVGSGSLIIEGDTATPANVAVSASSGRSFWCRGVTNCIIRGFRLTGSTGLEVADRAIVSATSVEFAGGTYAVNVQPGGSLTFSGSWSVSGDYSIILLATDGYISTWGSTVTFVGARSVSIDYTRLGSAAQTLQSNTTVVGSLTGRRASVATNSILSLQGAAESTLPGSTAASVTTQGQIA